MYDLKRFVGLDVEVYSLRESFGGKKIKVNLTSGFLENIISDQLIVKTSLGVLVPIDFKNSEEKIYLVTSIDEIVLQ